MLKIILKFLLRVTLISLLLIGGFILILSVMLGDDIYDSSQDSAPEVVYISIFVLVFLSPVAISAATWIVAMLDIYKPNPASSLPIRATRMIGYIAVTILSLLVAAYVFFWFVIKN